MRSFHSAVHVIGLKHGKYICIQHILRICWEILNYFGRTMMCVVCAGQEKLWRDEPGHPVEARVPALVSQISCTQWHRHCQVSGVLLPFSCHVCLMAVTAIAIEIHIIFHFLWDEKKTIKGIHLSCFDVLLINIPELVVLIQQLTFLFVKVCSKYVF